jgi:hypothetical protein
MRVSIVITKDESNGSNGIEIEKKLMNVLDRLTGEVELESTDGQGESW